LQIEGGTNANTMQNYKKNMIFASLWQSFLPGR